MPAENPRRFVVQQHILSADPHWDLMLESGDFLVTWQLSDFPPTPENTPLPAQKIFDHRKVYLEYEGPVSGGRGHVQIADRGTFVLFGQSNVEWEVDFAGAFLRGRYRIVQSPEDPEQWTLRPVPA